MEMGKIYSAINIQFPISQLIIAGIKTIETRTYPLPPKYINQPLLIVETPGKTGKFQARIIGIVVFSESFKYKSKSDFYRDSKKHCVTNASPWRWTAKSKWGWPISKIIPFRDHMPAPTKKGIVFTTGIRKSNSLKDID